MKGKYLVIGIILFVIAIIAGIYFTAMATFNKADNGIKPIISAIEIMDTN